MKIIPRSDADEQRQDAIQASQRNNEELFAKERAFVKQLLEFATAYNINLNEISDINITTLKDAAKEAGATHNDILAMSTALQTLSFDIAACSDSTWKETWASFKGRIPEYLRENGVNI